MPSAPGVGRDTPPQVGSCRATFGCCTGTIKKSATYEIPFAQSAGAALSVNLLNTKERQKTEATNEKSFVKLEIHMEGYRVYQELDRW